MQGLKKAHACDVLGISHNASKKEIAKAYKELARIHHPDKSSCPQASETFKKIKEAYDTLMLMQANRDAEEDSTAEDSLPPVQRGPQLVCKQSSLPRSKWLTHLVGIS